MPDNFVPLPAAISSGSEPTSFRAKVISRAAPATDFQPFALPAARSTNHAHPGTDQPTVQLKREGDRIVGLQIHCTCGQCLELAFTF